ncbi:DNA polymerase III subunit beta [Arthrobacter sp. efr-133-R2A-63]|uniref:DNA polymerase III subunit beta n=1 Tax=Arthrobacter sp. efr-133-R2A-63 TaxID=3040278 RepID=UPI00254A52D1|nr:DNA polymerase III subunit beta [Arthrobacter sp. efr-133-R2A-63]
MKFTIPANALADAAAYASKGINPRPPMPILSGLLIEAVAGTLRISGFDYDKSARTSVAADVHADGNVLLPGKMFTEIIRKFGKKTVTVEVNGSAATLTSGSAVFKIGTMPVADFPPMPGLPAAAGKVDGDVFAAAVAQVIGAAATDNTLPVLTGVKIVSEGPQLSFLTTDRYRLAQATIPWAPAGDDISVLVRGSWLAEAAKNLAGEAQILASENLFGIRSGNRAATATILDLEYPKIQTLFPESTETTITVDRSELADVLGRVSLVAEQNTPVRITASGAELVIEAGTGVGATGTETIPCELDGTDVEVAFNPGYFAWSLAVTPSEQVTIGFQKNRAKPALITGHDGLAHLIMPVKL